MVYPVIVTNESISDAAELQQTIPVRIVPRQTRDLQSEDDAHVSQRHFAGEASKPAAFLGAGRVQHQNFVDDHDLLLGPSELASSIGQGILASGGLAIMLNLARRRLANVNVSGALGYSLREIWERSKCVPTLRGRLAFLFISKLYRQMYANTGISTDSARRQKATRMARWLAVPCRKLFEAKPMPELEMPVLRRSSGLTSITY